MARQRQRPGIRPQAMEEAQHNYGSRDDLTLTGTKEAALKNADALIIMTEWQSFRAPYFDLLSRQLRQPLIFDGRNLFDPQRMRSRGLHTFPWGNRLTGSQAMISLELIGHFTPQLLETNKAFSFINFASIGSFFDQNPNTIAYFCDGMLMSTFMSRVTGRTIGRVSFDFTSIADPVFGCAEKQGKRVYFVGARQDELDLFIKKVELLYPALIIAGHHNGYFDATQAARIQADICRSEANILIVGLGAGLQEQFVLNALQIGFSGVAFTCGGFIHQEAMTKHHYYPELVNRLHLRAFYRMYREPSTIKRYLLDYPTNFVLLLIMIVRHKLTIKLTAP